MTDSPARLPGHGSMDDDSDNFQAVHLALFHEYAKDLCDADAHELGACIEQRIPESFRNPVKAEETAGFSPQHALVYDTVSVVTLCFDFLTPPGDSKECDDQGNGILR